MKVSSVYTATVGTALLGLVKGQPSPFLPKTYADGMRINPEDPWYATHSEQLTTHSTISKGSDVPNFILNDADDSLRAFTQAFLEGYEFDLSKYDYYDPSGNPPPDINIANIEQLIGIMQMTGVVMLHQGEVVFENYNTPQTVNTRHQLRSASKSYAGLTTMMLEEKGLLSFNDLVVTWLPEVAGDGKAFDDGATIRDLLDMTADFEFNERLDECPERVRGWIVGEETGVYDFFTDTKELWAQGFQYPVVKGCEFYYYFWTVGEPLLDPVVAANEVIGPYYVFQQTRDIEGLQNSHEHPWPQDLRDYITKLRAKEPSDPTKRPHGTVHDYKTANTDVLTWINNRVIEQNTAMLGVTDALQYFEEYVWKKLGQDHDAYIKVDPTHFPYFGAGMSITTRDMARFGQMLSRGGKNHQGEQVVPESIVHDLLGGGGPENFAKYQNFLYEWDVNAYRSQFLTAHPYPKYSDNPDQKIIIQRGYFGQIVWVDPLNDFVVAFNANGLGGNFFYPTLYPLLVELGNALGELTIDGKGGKRGKKGGRLRV